MPQGKPEVVPEDGLTTRQRRNRPLLIVHTGEMKGKSTAAFGLALRAWNQGWSIGVFQFVKSAKWRSARRPRSARWASCTSETGEGGPVEWHKMGEGWSWIAQGRHRGGPRRAPARAGQRSSAARRRDARFYVLDEFTYPIKWGWIDVDDVVETLATGPATSTSSITGRDAPPQLIEAADLVTEMTKVKHPMDAGQKGQRGIEW